MLSTAPLSFLGLGVYRTWIEIAFVGTTIDFPTHRVAAHDAFDLVMVVAMLALAALHKRITPLRERRWARPVAVALLVLSTAGEFASVWRPDLAAPLAWPCAVAGGVGIAVMILPWSELYACESPVRICLLYAPSLVCGALVVYAYRGFKADWLPVMTCLLPVISIACLSYAWRSVPQPRRPVARAAAFTFPWKPIAVVSIYCFAFGLQEVSSYGTFGPHSAPGMVACSLLVVAVIVTLSGRVEFQTIYGTWLPFLSATLLAAQASLPVAPLVAVAVLVATFMVVSEKRLDSAWGVRVQPDGEGEPGDVTRRGALVSRCSDLARAHGLTQREEEVLILLAEHKTAGDIERELLIANGTAKAHIGHVYQKLGIHSREQLFEVTGAEGVQRPAGAAEAPTG